MRNRSKQGQDRDQKSRYPAASLPTPQAAFQNRLEVQKEINSMKINLDRSVFVKTDEEKTKLSVEKANWRKKSNTLKSVLQEELMGVMAGFLLSKNPNVPAFGGLTLIVSKYE